MIDEQRNDLEHMTVAVANGLIFGRNPTEYQRWARRRAPLNTAPRQSPEEFRATLGRLAATGKVRIH